MPRPKQAPSRAEGAPHWVIVGASSTADLLRREVRDGWTGRVRLESGEVVEGTFDGERLLWRNDDGEPIHGVVAVDLTRCAPARLRSERFATLLLPGYRDRLSACAAAEGDTIAEWLERQVERCELEAEMRGTVGT